jgi:TPR repeat protein
MLWLSPPGYHQARVKLGDYYYYGLGTQVSYEAAATQYRMASDKQGTPQAMFNLGYMYEHGEGLEKVSILLLVVKFMLP